MRWHMKDSKKTVLLEADAVWLFWIDLAKISVATPWKQSVINFSQEKGVAEGHHYFLVEVKVWYNN